MNDLELLANYKEDLLNNGFSIIETDHHRQTWFHFSKDNKIGYVQCAYFGGLSFSTVNIPCKECGTGFAIDGSTVQTGISAPTIQDALNTFVIAPNWARQSERNAVKKYKDIEDFLKRETVLKHKVIKPYNLAGQIQQD